MPDKEKPVLLFKPPNSDGWHPLEAAGFDDEDELDEDEAGDEVEPAEDVEHRVEANRHELKNALLASLKMQNLVVLAGSGCSLSVGGPSMWDLWLAVVGEEPEEAEREIAKIVGYDIEDEDHQDIEAFLSWIEAYLYLHDDDDVETFLHEAKKIILDQCTGFFDDAELAGHQTLLHRLARRRARDHRLKVFTTNYDLCFEAAASALGVVALDGFSFTAPRVYDPRFFNYDIVVRGQGGGGQNNFLPGVFLLHKLHGSVNWARGEDDRITEKAEPDGEEACLIYPAKDKYQQSYTQPYLESMAQYLSAIREPNTCVLVAGFGFNDNHLSEPLLAAVKSNPHLRLVIVDFSPKQKVEDEKQYWVEFAELAEDGEDIWMIQADFGDFARLIPDLQSLTPAESLMKAVKGAVGGA